MASEERDLVERAKSDPEAFGQLYDRHLEDIHAYVFARLRNVAAAQDVTHDVFTNALRAMPRYRDQGRPFSCWLFRIAANEVANYYRHEPAHAELVEDTVDEAPSLEETAVTNLERAQLWRLIAELPPQQQLALRLRFAADLSTRDAGEIMGKSPDAVKLLTYRAVRHLRRLSQGDPRGRATLVPVAS